MIDESQGHFHIEVRKRAQDERNYAREEDKGFIRRYAWERCAVEEDAKKTGEERVCQRFHVVP